MTCKYCGKQQPGGVSYCVYCGQKLDEEERPRRCLSCGAELPPGTAFCGACGAPVRPPKPQADDGVPRWLTALAAGLGVVILVLMGVVVAGLVMTGQEDGDDVAALSGIEEEETDVPAGGEGPDPESGQTEQEPAEASEEEAQSETVPEQEDSPQLETSSLGWVFRTDYFELAGEGSWSDWLYSSRDGRQWDFCHKASADAGYGGSLFGITLYESGHEEEYHELPAYRVLGELETAEGERYDVVADFPTDVQFSEETREEYYQLRENVDAVLDTFTPAEGCQFTPRSFVASATK